MFPYSEIIVDANVLFSFFKPGSARLQIIENLLDNDVKLIAPYFLYEELVKNKEKIKTFSKISEGEFRYALSLLYDEISLISEDGFKQLLKEAHLLSPHLYSSKDDPYFALSLLLNNCPIWSDEKSFFKQDKIKIFSTKDLLNLFSKKDD